MFRIKHELIASEQYVVDLKGKWVTEILIEKLKKASKIQPGNLNARFTVATHDRGLLDNEAYITFPVGSRVSDVAETVEWLDLVLQPVVGSAFTEIGVNIYDIPYTENAGGLTILLEIAKEVGCGYDAGTWRDAPKLYPEDNLQYNQIIDLLQAFGMKYN